MTASCRWLPGTSLAVIGEFARTPRYQGAGSSQVIPTRVDAILDELSALHGGDGTTVTFAPGYGLDDDGPDAALRAEAVAVAAAADTVVVVIGLPGADESEGFDRTHMNVPAAQLETLAAVAQANPNVVVVLVNGSTVVLGDVLPHARALVEAWLGGQAAGGAVADVLTGRVNPSGRLAETFPHRLEDNSSYLNFPGDSQVVRYGEGIFIGYRGYDKAAQDVAFPFGYGLSYTSFDLSDLSVATSGSVAEGTFGATVSVTVTNTGDREGAEVVQVYVEDLDSTVPMPVRQLRGFAKVVLAAGESAEVSVDLDQRAFSFWSTVHGRWAVEAGDFVIAVGRHSRDLPLTETVAVEAPSLAAPLTAGSTLEEWMADDHGRELLLAQLASSGSPGLDDDLVAVIGNFPMSALANFNGMLLDRPTLDRISAQWQQESRPRS